MKQEKDTQQINVNNASVNLCEVMLKQNDIAEVLVKQLRLSTIFNCDPREFKSFTRAFEHTIHCNVDNDSERLYYLELFIRGEPKDLVRSCQHLSPKQSYSEARNLLTYHYGIELKISTAYVKKALNLPLTGKM